MALGYRNAVAVAQVVFYSPAFPIALYLVFRHGWQRSSGWFFIALFTLVRLLGAALRLATINNPTNINLYIGSSALSNIGLSPLLLCSLGLISRVLFSIHKSQETLVKANFIRLIEILSLVALILSIVGSTSIPASSFADPSQLQLPGTMTASIALFIVAFAALVLFVLCLWSYANRVEPGEKRLLVAISLSLPFLMVRLIYAAIVVFGHVPSFNWLDGSVSVYLGMEIIMEAVVVVIYEGVGLSLNQLSSEDRAHIVEERRRRGPRTQNYGQELESGPYERHPFERQRPERGGAGNTLKRIGRRTLIGRLIIAVTGEK